MSYSTFSITLLIINVSGLEFSYCRAPRSMQSFVTSLFFIVNGFGALLTTFITVSYTHLPSPRDGLLFRMPSSA